MNKKDRRIDQMQERLEHSKALFRVKVQRDRLAWALWELIQDSECYCADGVAAKGPCGYCKAKGILAEVAKED
jgi:hypothetical protein